MAAIAAKEASAKSPALAPAAKDANAEAAEATSSQDSAAQKTHPKAVRCPQFRGEITYIDGQKKIFCKKCKHTVSYNGWGQHCTAHHSENDSNDMEKDDDGDQTDAVQPEVTDAVSTRKVPTGRQGQTVDRSNDSKPAPRKRKASENDWNPKGEKRNAPAKATGKHSSRRKG